jgi:hypothetical protein
MEHSLRLIIQVSDKFADILCQHSLVLTFGFFLSICVQVLCQFPWEGVLINVKGFLFSSPFERINENSKNKRSKEQKEKRREQISTNGVKVTSSAAILIKWYL